MPYKNYYFPDDNLILNIFYGTVGNHDVRNHAMELVKQDKLKEGYIKITDTSCIKGVNITRSIVYSGISTRTTPNVIKNGKSIIVNDSKEFGDIAEMFSNELIRQGDCATITKSINEALEIIEKTHLLDIFSPYIDKYMSFGITE